MDRLKEYAKLLVEVGLNVQKGENVLITSQVEDPRLAYLVTEEAYAQGARDVVVRWVDDKIDRMHYLNASDDVFETFPEWLVKYFEHFNEHNTNYLNIYSSDPEALKGADPARIMQMVKLSNEALSDHISKLMGNEQSWCIAAIPSKAWAKKIFPELTEDEAVSKLWDTIFDIVRVGNGEAIEKWHTHTATMRKRNDYMNSKNFKSLHFKSSNGTDLNVGLVKNHIWCGGSEENIVNKKEFVANIPTEECFTMPDCNRVNGVVYSTKPLSYHGNLIDEFMLEFKDGVVVNYDAKQGLEVLKSILDTDEGAKRIGEVALVPYSSPISEKNILFYNTLFDENASCHLALGRAYPMNIEGFEEIAEEEKLATGINHSAIHEDFMIGDKDTEIIGETYNGEFVTVFKDGNFVI